MTYDDCRKAWTEPGEMQPADSLDAKFPLGACEIYSLANPRRSSVPDDELVARVLTAPNHYDQNLNEILTAKLTSAYANGVSLIRTGAPDAEILAVINALLAISDPQQLVGAIVMPANRVRDNLKHFCVYDTDAPPQTKHADIVGTFDRTLSKSAWKTECSKRRKELRDRMASCLVVASTPVELLTKLRAAGM